MADDAGGLFEINATTGDISLVSDMDLASGYSGIVTVQVTDPHGETFDESVSIQIDSGAESRTTDATNFADTSNGYTVTAQNISGGTLTAASVANVSAYSAGTTGFGANGTAGDGDSESCGKAVAKCGVHPVVENTLINRRRVFLLRREWRAIEAGSVDGCRHGLLAVGSTGLELGAAKHRV